LVERPESPGPLLFPPATLVEREPTTDATEVPAAKESHGDVSRTTDRFHRQRSSPCGPTCERGWFNVELLLGVEIAKSRQLWLLGFDLTIDALLNPLYSGIAPVPGGATSRYVLRNWSGGGLQVLRRIGRSSFWAVEESQRCSRCSDSSFRRSKSFVDEVVPERQRPCHDRTAPSPVRRRRAPVPAPYSTDKWLIGTLEVVRLRGQM
jgi:hypothetical protein